MISHNLPPHKWPRFRFLVLVILVTLATLFSLAGCSGGSDSDQSKARSGSGKDSGCSASLDLSGWEAFLALGDRARKGEELPSADLEAFGNLPSITVWRESMTPRPPTAQKMGNWIEGAFWDQIGNGRPVKQSGDRSSFGTAMRFSYDHRQDINTLLARFENEGYLCNTLAMAEFWLDPENLPQPFVVHFVAGRPELRSHHGQLIADTGILLAGGPRQLSRQLVAILYRDRQGVPGDSPLEVDGAASVAHTLRTMMNEGVAAWIDDMPNTHFDAVHPRLGKVSFVPEDIYGIGIRAIDIFNTNLPPMLANPDQMALRGQGIARAITGSGAFTQGGYCMAAVIAHHLGEERLHAVRRSPAAFLAAFQEAALQNPLPLPHPGESGVQLPFCMPAFDPEVFAGLEALLQEQFPEG